MSKKYPPLTPKQVESNLTALGFKHVGNKGDHKVFELGHKSVEVDQGKEAKRGFATPGMKIIIFKAGLSDKPELFYQAGKNTAKKINKPALSKEELRKIKDKLLNQ